jgi:hypothetical protein
VDFAGPDAADLCQVVLRVGQQRPRDAPHPVLVLLLGQILDRRFAADPRKKESRQQIGRPEIDLLARLLIDEAQVGLHQTVESGQQPGSR